MHQEEDICFYPDKCVNLEKIVEDHLQINLNLKDQLQKLKSTNFNSKSYICLGGFFEKLTPEITDTQSNSQSIT